MKRSEISTEPLKKAIASLELAIEQPLNEFTRDSVNHRFEYTFELCWRSLLKFIELDHPLTDRSVKGILREAHSLSYIEDLEQWFRFQEARNLTSHTDIQETALEVHCEAIKLPSAAHLLLNKLK